MDYNKWALEYFDEAEKIKRNISKLNLKLKENLTAREKKDIQKMVLTFRSIYYECMITGKHLKRRGEAIVN